MNPRAAVTLLELAAFWPVWPWYARRISDGSDEPWPLLALGLALGPSLLLALRARATGSALRLTVPRAARWAPCLGMLCYGMAVPGAPPLVRALLALATLGVTVAPSAAHFGLFVLAAPAIGSLDFYLGYPLRVVTGSIAAFMLRASGLSVVRDGTLLRWGDQLVAVDAPCSGVRMLWAGMFVAVLACALLRTAARRTLLVLLGAFVTIVLGNALRSAALLPIEAGLLSMPDFAHAGVGLLVFALVAAAIVSTAYALTPHALTPHALMTPHIPTRAALADTALRAPNPPAAWGHAPTAEAISPDAALEKAATPPRRPAHPLAACAVLAVIVSVVPLVTPAAATARVETAAPVWPTTLDGVPLHEAADTTGSTDHEAPVRRQFAGHSARFAARGSAVVVRYVAGATRELHSSRDCYRGAGYATKPLPIRRAPGGADYGCFDARRGGEAYVVCERVRTVATDAPAFTDVSSWYWQATLGRVHGPFWAITVVQPVEGPT